jgi:hypothetical protein
METVHIRVVAEVLLEPHTVEVEAAGELDLKVQVRPGEMVELLPQAIPAELLQLILVRGLVEVLVLLRARLVLVVSEVPATVSLFGATKHAIL